MNIRPKKSRALIPLNSMSDIAFLLLVFIMLISLINYRVRPSLEYALSENSSILPDKGRTEISIDRRGDVYLEGKRISAGELAGAVLSGSRGILLVADKNAEYGAIHDVLEILQKKAPRPLVSFAVKTLP